MNLKKYCDKMSPWMIIGIFVLVIAFMIGTITYFKKKSEYVVEQRLDYAVSHKKVGHPPYQMT